MLVLFQIQCLYSCAVWKAVLISTIEVPFTIYDDVQSERETVLAADCFCQLKTLGRAAETLDIKNVRVLEESLSVLERKDIFL